MRRTWSCIALLCLAVMAWGRNGGPASGQEVLKLFEVKLKVPLGLTEADLVIPEDNPLTPAKVALGRQLYIDPRLIVLSGQNDM